MRTTTTANTRRRSDSRRACAATTRTPLDGRLRAVAASDRRAPRRPDRRPRASSARGGPRRCARRRRPGARRWPAPRRAWRPRSAACRPASRPRRRAGATARPGGPRPRSSPWSMIATRSQTRSTSLSRWVLSSTATPRRRSSPSRSRTIRRPTGSSALVGSSSSSSRGPPTSACAIPRRCCMPFDIASTRRPPSSPSPTSSSSSARSAAPPVEPDRRWCRCSSSSARGPAGEAEELGQVAERAPRGRRPGRGAAHAHGPRRRADEPRGALDQRRLARAVGPEQADELGLADRQVDPAQRVRWRRSAWPSPGPRARASRAAPDDTVPPRAGWAGAAARRLEGAPGRPALGDVRRRPLDRPGLRDATVTYDPPVVVRIAIVVVAVAAIVLLGLAPARPRPLRLRARGRRDARRRADLELPRPRPHRRRLGAAAHGRPARRRGCGSRARACAASPTSFIGWVALGLALRERDPAGSRRALARAQGAQPALAGTAVDGLLSVAGAGGGRRRSLKRRIGRSTR